MWRHQTTGGPYSWFGILTINGASKIGWALAKILQVQDFLQKNSTTVFTRQYQSTKIQSSFIDVIVALLNLAISDLCTQILECIQ